MPEAFAKLILGHAGGSITYGLYGAVGVSIDTLHDEMASKVFDCSGTKPSFSLEIQTIYKGGIGPASFPLPLPFICLSLPR